MAIKKLLKQVIERPPRKPDSDNHGGGGGHDESNWLVSYADMMTLLCGFFIMLFSMAKMDEPKYESMKQEVSKQFGGEYHAPDSQQMAKFATQVMDEAGLSKEIVIRHDYGGMTVTFQSKLFFDTLGADVSPQGKEILNKLIGLVNQRQEKEGKKYKIVVEGHTDSRPIVSGAYPSNWELSSARASRVVRLFLDKGFAPDHLTAIGYADTRPEVQDRDESGTLVPNALAKNRRVVLRVLEPGTEGIPLPENDKSMTVDSKPPAAVAPAAPTSVAVGKPAEVRAPASTAATTSSALSSAPNNVQGSVPHLISAPAGSLGP